MCVSRVLSLSLSLSLSVVQQAALAVLVGNSMASEMGGDGAWEANNLAFGFVPSMVAKAVCELGIPDILAAQEEPMSALQIVERLGDSITRPLQEAAEQLDRMMKCLSAYGVFKAHVEAVTDVHVDGSLGGHVDEAAESHVPLQAHVDSYPSLHASLVKYSLPSDWLQSGAAMLLFQMSPPMQAPWHHLSQSLLHGSPPFKATHSMDVWDLVAADPPLHRLFNSAMATSSHLSLLALLKHYDGFRTGVLTLVDVGGGTGTIASSIVSHYPSIKAINFDLPGVVATAPIYPGVEHVGGDMFESIPKGDAIFMKWILHDWDDKSCIKILENCRKVLPRHGKLIIMDAVLDDTFMKDSPFNKLRMALDIVMIAHTTGGKERTKQQWDALLWAAKFKVNRIIDLPCPQCIIEAIPI